MSQVLLDLPPGPVSQLHYLSLRIRGSKDRLRRDRDTPAYPASPHDHTLHRARISHEHTEPAHRVMTRQSAFWHDEMDVDAETRLRADLEEDLHLLESGNISSKLGAGEEWIGNYQLVYFSERLPELMYSYTQKLLNEERTL